MYLLPRNPRNLALGAQARRQAVPRLFNMIIYGNSAFLRHSLRLLEVCSRIGDIERALVFCKHVSDLLFRRDIGRSHLVCLNGVPGKVIADSDTL
jgi:hypothetical protein